MEVSAAKKDHSTRKNKHKKRKLANAHDTPKCSKSSRTKINREEEYVDEEETAAKMEVEDEKMNVMDEGSQWRNLELVLSIQSKDISAHKKVELVYDFVKSRANKEDIKSGEEFNTLSTSRSIMYISNWIQSVLIMSEKKIRARDEESEQSWFCLDNKCWEIFKFCLEESLRLRVSLTLSRDLLRVVSCVARSASHVLNSVQTDVRKSSFIMVEFEFYKTVNDCLKLLFSSHVRLLNGNLDLWAVAIGSLLELVIKVFSGNIQYSDVGSLMIELSCMAFEPFAKFLKLHPCRKNGFRDFVDKLLEQLLHLVSMLHDHIRDNGPIMVQNLFRFVEEILSYGLFHSVHLDEYLNLHSTEKYSSSADGKWENARTVIKSYHRHLFDKVENLVSERKVQALSGIGEMFHLFVGCAKKLKRESEDREGLRPNDSQSTKAIKQIGNLTSEKSNVVTSTNGNTRKSIFDFFVLIMEPLLLDLRKHLESELQPGTSLMGACSALKSVNKILCSMVRERVYVRTEDSGGACLNFFKLSYGLLFSLYAKFIQLWQSKWCNGDFAQVDILHSLAKEFVLVVRNFLEIEYEVFGDDLVNIWLMILSILSIVHSSETVSVTIDLGCRVLKLYSELRQVNHAVFALCKGLRHLSFYQGEGEMKSSEFVLSDFALDPEKMAKSGHILLCSQKFRLAICNAIKSIPEGQASGCVQTLSADISDSLEWMKVACSVTDECEIGDGNSLRRFSTQAEILGMVLSEIYSLGLDSLLVTTGNSYRMGVSIQKLMGVLRPCMTHLIALEEDGADEFIHSVLAITSQNKTVECKNVLQDRVPLLLLFFFRMYVSCRSLYRQVLSLMPPDSSKKMSGIMGDTYTALSGDDLMEMTDFGNEGYFSWIVQTSPSLVSVMLFIKESFLKEGSTYHSILIYVMHLMALQRLVDLNREIQSLEYLVQRNESLISSKMDDADLSTLRKKKRKQEKVLSGLKQEATSLTDFIMGYLSVANEEQLPISVHSVRTAKSSAPDYMEFESWDLGFCTVNEKTLHTTVWWMICQNIDIWCNFASKKNLKVFLSLVIYNSLPCGRYGEIEEDSRDYAGEEIKVTKGQTSQRILCDTNFYDQRFVCRYMVSRICNILKNFVPLLFKDSIKINKELNSSDWAEVLSLLTNMAARDKPIAYNCSYGELHEEHCRKDAPNFPLNHVTACRNLLNLLGRLPERFLSFESFSECVVHLINFERLIVGSLLDQHGAPCLHDHFELLGLLLSSRRALKFSLMAFCENSKACNSSNLPKFLESSSSILWLLKSLKLVVAWWTTLSPEHKDSQVNDTILSLVDHTSYVFVTICKHQFGLEVHSILKPKISGKSELNSQMDFSNESSSSPKNLKDVKDCNSLIMIVDALEDETKSYFPTLKEAFRSENGELVIPSADLNKLSCVLSCIQGFLWGLECALNDIGTTCNNLKAKLMKRKLKTISRINNFVDTFVEFIGMASQMFVRNDQPLNISCGDQGQLHAENDKQNQGTSACLKEVCTFGFVFEYGNQDGKSGCEEMPNHQSDSDCILLPKQESSAIGGLMEFGSFNYNCLRMDLLQGFLSGQNLEAAFFLRRLLIASSATVRLSTLINCSPLSSNIIRVFMGCSELLLTKFSQMPDMPNPSSFVWLDGTLKFLEALGSQLPLTSPASTQIIYTKLVELHIKAIGKCISLQGKGATLLSHDFESSTKVFTQSQVPASTVSDGLYGLDELKTRLRMSFKFLIEKPSEQHLLSVLQALEQALVGTQVGFTTSYDVKMEINDGGLVSTVVAAGVDCLDLLLEFLKGNQLLNVVRTHLSALLASLFNIVVHLQSPKIFYGILNSTVLNKSPDSGSVVLMCVEVLTRIAGKPALFHLDSHHVGQSLHIPATLFQGFHNLRAGKPSHQSFLRSTDSKEDEDLECCVDRQFSINLFAASCRLLWTVVKHHKSCVQCVALLQTSLQALLRCLETVNTDSADKKACFTWEVEEGVKCASYLRRVYEEIRQQKEVFGQHCFMFLSDYIWLFSGYGPLKSGIKREVDEALRPGVYALVDVCSPDDLQYLHTVFGEGPCRSTLASLKHDYERNFKYGGKV